MEQWNSYVKLRRIIIVSLRFNTHVAKNKPAFDRQAILHIPHSSNDHDGKSIPAEK